MALRPITHASTRWLRLIVFLIINLVSITKALVAIPERRPVMAFTPRGFQGRLFLENSPLIGGPSWLPLHVKLIVEHENVCHRWDFVPLNATDTNTLRQLVTLQAVPAEIRYQSASVSVQQQRKDRTPRYLGAGFDIVLGSDSTSVVNGNEVALDDERRIATIESVVDKANKYCDTYQRDLHLLQNNCWTFGFQLYNHLRGDFEQ